MRLSMRTQYALRALIALATYRNNEPVKARELARREKIPVKFLEQVLATLKQGGLVLSKRGCNGGYTLARSPSQITLGELIRHVETPDAGITGVEQTASYAGLKEIMEQVDQATNYLLDRFSLEEIARRSQKSSQEKGQTALCI